MFSEVVLKGGFPEFSLREYDPIKHVPYQSVDACILKHVFVLLRECLLPGYPKPGPREMIGRLVVAALDLLLSVSVANYFEQCTPQQLKQPKYHRQQHR